ncbi:uncharacterized protein [Apostichopus japonicus]|uniref:uncharacterized protein n=1 Tax=Stichopus japonicus TaxID=307972 RepID=UPI003AB1A4F9
MAAKITTTLTVSSTRLWRIFMLVFLNSYSLIASNITVLDNCTHVCYVPTSSSIELPCALSDGEIGKWLHNGQLIIENFVYIKYPCNDTVEIYEKNTLRIKNVSLCHEGNFTCKGKGTNGTEIPYVIQVEGGKNCETNYTEHNSTTSSFRTNTSEKDNINYPTVPMRQDKDRNISGVTKLLLIIVTCAASFTMSFACIFGYYRHKIKSRFDVENQRRSRNHAYGQQTITQVQIQGIVHQVEADSTPSLPTFSPEDVQLVCELPSRGMFRYYKATLSKQPYNGLNIIAKTISDFAQVQDLYTFRDLAHSLTLLSDHVHLVTTLHIAVVEIPHTIYQEFCPNGTLRDFLLRNSQQAGISRANEYNSTWSVDVKYLTKSASEIAYALAFLTEKDYRHPELTTGKILLTETGNCKVYDFWPEKLTKKRIDHLLEKPNPPVAWLAPETIFCRQYSAQSDVWNLAVVLWEIFSFGDIPNAGSTCDEIEKKIRSGVFLDKPFACPGGIFCKMLQSWDASEEKRPSVHEICRILTRSSFHEIGQDTEDDYDHVEADEVQYFALDVECGANDYSGD